MSEYANKELMLEQISKHRELYYAAKEAGIEERDRPKPPNELIKTFYRMIDGIGSRHNFNGYPFLDIMKSEAIIACYRKAHCFDPRTISFANNAASPNPITHTNTTKNFLIS